MDSEGSQVPPVPPPVREGWRRTLFGAPLPPADQSQLPPPVREGWGGVDLVSDVLKILGWITLVGGIVGGIVIAIMLHSSCDCTGSIYCDCTEPGGLEAASVIGGFAGGVLWALLFWAFAFILDMLEAIWLQTGGHRPRALAVLPTAPNVGGRQASTSEDTDPAASATR
jgi:hypothetical protein